MLRTFISATTLALAIVAAPLTGRAGDIAEATLGETSPSPDISTAEMRRIVKDGSAIIIDTRTVTEFDAGHLPGANLIERTSTARVENVGKIAVDKSKRLVLYCNGPYCQASRVLAGELVKAGYTNVARYQLGLPVWRALGGVVAIERDGIARVFKADQTAIFIDTRSPAEFAKGSLSNALNIQPDALAKAKLPEDDFNRRIVLFGADEAQTKSAADVMGKRPWHNVSYYPGSFESLRQVLASR